MAEYSPNASTPQTTKRSRVVVLIVLALVLLFSSFWMTNRPESDTIIVRFPSGQEMAAEVADTPEKRLFGLAFREGLPPNSGMLYIFDTSDRHRVWTKGFRIPVDVIWVDASRRVVHLEEDVPPCERDPCPYYGPPPADARYIIETASGFTREEGLKPGAELKFTLVL